MMEYLYNKAAIGADIQIYENEQAVDLLAEDGRCTGIITKGTDERVYEHHSHFTILATGGAAVYSKQRVTILLLSVTA